VVPEPRLAPYRRVAGDDPEQLGAFYRWAGRLALALLADISVLEVALRSAMARELVRVHGQEWYRRTDLFDDDCAKALATAWSQGGLRTLVADGAGPDVVEGKLVAALMFGFWVKLLGRGSYAGREPLRRRRIYDTLLWRPALAVALPNAPARSDAEHAARIVQQTRNRVAHHEHVMWGIPLPGQGRRLAVAEAHDALLRLAGFISAETRTWIEATSELAAVLEACPVNPAVLALR
jgi:hypothetical protein